MRMRKAVIITLIVTMLLALSFYSAAAISLKAWCNTAGLGAKYDEVNNECVFDAAWVERICFSFNGRRDQVVVIGVVKQGNLWYEDCVSRTVSTFAEPIDLYSGNCSAYIGSPPPGGISLGKISNFAYMLAAALAICWHKPANCATGRVITCMPRCTLT